jgi:hypothetical protein
VQVLLQPSPERGVQLPLLHWAFVVQFALLLLPPLHLPPSSQNSLPACAPSPQRGVSAQA